VAHHPEDRTLPGVTVLRVEAGLFFANADHVHAAIQNAVTNGAQAVVPDCETMPTIDVTAARMLSQLATDLQRPGMRLVSPGSSGRSVTWWPLSAAQTAPRKSSPGGTPHRRAKSRWLTGSRGTEAILSCPLVSRGWRPPVPGALWNCTRWAFEPESV
jgi:MFS superfamily sulfate permease-like transporter